MCGQLHANWLALALIVFAGLYVVIPVIGVYIIAPLKGREVADAKD